MRNLLRFCTSVFFLFQLLSVAYAQDLGGPAFSVDPKILLKAAGDIHQDKPSAATVLFRESTFEFDAQSRVVETYHTIYRVNTAEGVEGWSESSIRWEPWHQGKPEIRTRVITVDGTVRELDPKTLTDRPVHEESTIYTDDRILAAPIPSVSPGVIVEEQIVTRDTAPFFSAGLAREMYFIQSVPVLKTRLVLRHPASIPLTYSLKLLPNATQQKRESAGVEEIVVENGSIDAYETVEHAPADVVLYPQVTFGTGGSWHDVAAAYSQTAEQKIQQRVAEKDLQADLQNASSPAEKMRRLVALLHQHVRYTGVEFGESALIPQPPSETWKRGYGDCKDKSALLVSLLREAGIPAHLALLQTGPGADIDADHPGMGLFDHAIVFVPGDAPIWIDATAQYMPVGALPDDDQGRLALVIDDHTTQLVKTPEPKPEDNLLVETRDVHLAEYGPAHITESWEPHGDIEAEYRSYYAPDQTEKRKKELESYVKSAYLADSLTKMEPGGNDSLLKPFTMKLDVRRGRRGFTGLQDAAVLIYPASLTDRLPQELRTTKDKNAEEKKRSIDYIVEPFVTEWRYHIFPPAGFEARTLPSRVEKKIGPAVLTESFVAEQNGSVTATLRFDTVRSRITAEEAKDFREAVVKFREEDEIDLTFDNIGHALLAKGKIAEGLAKYQATIGQNPKSGLERTRFADALLAAGLGEKARQVSDEAIKLDPQSAPAFTTRAWILEHDLVGRYLKSGSDHKSAVAAYKKALSLDPKDYQARINLAIAYEYDESGIRYARDAHLDAGVAEFRQLKKDDESRYKGYEDNLLFDLFYSGKYQDLLDEASALPASDDRRNLIVASTVAIKDVEAAEKKAAELTSEDAERDKVLVGAGQLAIRVRLYQKASALLAAGTQGSSNAQVSQQQVAIFSKMKKFEDIPIDDHDPTSPIQKMVRIWFSLGSDDLESYLGLMSKNSHDQDHAKEVADTKKALPILRSIVITSGLPPDVFLDLIASNIKVTREGDDEHGYREALQSAGAATQYFYVVKENGQYKILAAQEAKEVGAEVLDRLSRGDLATSKIMLDFARDQQPLAGGDDPLAGNVFPRFWTKGQEAGEEQMRAAALSLMVSLNAMNTRITMLEALSQKAPEAERSKFDLALTLAYQKLERWKDMKDTSERLLKAYPRSDRAIGLVVAACVQLKDWSTAEAAIHDRLQAEPDSMMAKRLSAQLLAAKGEFAKASDALRANADDSRATINDLNSFAWSGLFLPSVPPDMLEAAERGNSMAQGKQFPILHTLACLYAEVGKPVESRNLLMKAMEISNMAEPTSEVWYGFARLAEVYGQYDAAAVDYKRVEAPEIPTTFATYDLAQQHMRELAKKNPASSN